MEKEFESFKNMLMNKVTEEIERAISTDELTISTKDKKMIIDFIETLIGEEKEASALLFAKMLICFGVDVIEEVNRESRERILGFFKGVFDDE